MNAISEREQDVLEAVVRDYITNAIPVSSERVRNISDIDVSSATFRMILGDLEEAGYLAQPHTSAGRVPTQKGYRFFVDSCVSRYFSERASFYSSYDPETLIQSLTEKTHLFGAYIHMREHIYMQFGMGEALRAPEFLDSERVQAFGDLVDSVRNISEIYQAALAEEDHVPLVFIEEENPATEARSFSVVVANNDTDGIFFVAGPSRMDYERVVRLFRS